MPRQVILSALECEALLASPVNRDELIRWYTFSEPDVALIRQRRGDANRLGFAVQLCLLRYPGQGWAVDAPPDAAVVDTAGFTDHVFAMMHLLGFRFAPRIRDLADTKLYVPKGERRMPVLAPLIGGNLNVKSIRVHWNEILRLATSIKQGTVTASLMLRKLGSYPRQNGLAVALRELGRIERTLFIFDWLQSVELRRRVNAGLNKGEARNALARAVFFYRLGELRDRSFEQQRYRASGLNLVTAAIVLWNTVYLERATRALQRRTASDESLLRYLSPLGWEHINLTGDYVWRQNRARSPGKFRPLRVLSRA